MINFSTLRKHFIFRYRNSQYSEVLVYRLEHDNGTNSFYWKFETFEGPFSQQGLNFRGYTDLQAADSGSVRLSLPLTDEEQDQVDQLLAEQAGTMKFDWRPNEGLPEDYAF
jgi:phage-related protein